MVVGNKSEILGDVGTRMRTRRLGLNLSQADAAARSGVSVGTLKSFEAGHGISLWGFISLCRVYGHDQWIYELEPETVDDYAARIRPMKVRIRATKRKGTGHV